MNGKKCIFCGADIPEGRQLCPNCEKKHTHDAELLQAALDHTPVEHRGIKYGCISAFIIRTRISIKRTLQEPYIVQVELMSARSQSVTIADPKEVTVLKDWRPANE